MKKSPEPAQSETLSGAVRTHLGLGLNSWPPPADFPIMTTSDGTVLSYYSDSIWDLSHWAGKRFVLNFGDGAQRKDRAIVSAENAALLRQATAWLLLGPRAVRKATTLKAKFKLIKPIFVHCTAQGISAADLYRFPLVIESLGEKIKPSRLDEVVSVLHKLYDQRDQLGYTILDRPGISRLCACVSSHEEHQTPYIPPRIWNYVLYRCKEFIEQYLLNIEGIEGCFEYALDKYAECAGSLEAACAGDYDSRKAPFQSASEEGSFAKTCDRFGIRKLLETWIAGAGDVGSDEEFGPRVLSNYLGMAGYIGTIYLVARTLMRIEEAWLLRSDCAEVHLDETFGKVHLIRGRTSKTIQDEGALWVATESCNEALRMMTSASRLRMKTAEANPNVPTTEEYLRNPFLVPRPYEPWTLRKSLTDELSIRQSYQSLDAVVHLYPKFLDEAVMVIRKEDLDVARRVNPTLDGDKYSVGVPWILGWHQFRRTGAVNMFVSGLVSTFSLQHQMKHRTLLMTHFYCQGFSELALDEKTREEILRAMYDMQALDASEFYASDLSSPHGEPRKAGALAPVNGKDLIELRKLAKAGKIPWRETPFGGCTKQGDCEFGGFDNMIRCGGGDGEPPCAHGLFDNAKKPAVVKLKERIELQLVDAPKESPLKAWLTDVLASLRNIVNFMEGSPQK